jgi:hypothetical protein
MRVNLCGEIPLDMNWKAGGSADGYNGIRIRHPDDSFQIDRQSMVWGNEVGPGLAERIRILVGE